MTSKVFYINALHTSHVMTNIPYQGNLNIWANITKIPSKN